MIFISSICNLHVGLFFLLKNMRFVFLQLIISPSFSHCFTTFCGNFCSFLCLCYIWMKSVTDDTGVWTWIARQWKRRPPFTINRYNMPWTGCGVTITCLRVCLSNIGGSLNWCWLYLFNLYFCFWGFAHF